MNEEIKTEDRQHVRIYFENPIVIYQITQSQSGNVFMIDRIKILGKSKDISMGGIRAELANAASLSKYMKLNFELKKNGPLEIYTERIWEKAELCGLRFIQPDNNISKQISNYVSHP